MYHRASPFRFLNTPLITSECATELWKQRSCIFTARCYTERGIATASHPSVSPSVCDADV